MMNIPFADVPGWFAARKHAAELAIIHDGDAISWSALELRTTQRAHLLAEMGVKPGDFVAICLPNGLEFFEVTFAVWKLGGTICPLPFGTSVEEAKALLSLLKPSLLIGGDSSWGDWVHLPADRDVSKNPTTQILSPISRYWAALPSGGSTGRPKIIVQHMMAITGLKYRVPAGLASGYRVLNPGAPLHHAAPCLITHWALFLGGQVYSMPVFDPEETLRQIQKHKIDWVYLVPTMMHRIWKLPPKIRESYDLSTLKFVVHTASPMPPWLKEAWISWLGPERIIEHYGGSENIGGTVINGDEWLGHRGSVGRPPSGSVRIIDCWGRALPANHVGEICFEAGDGPELTFHYVGAEHRQPADGWATFGDFGYLDDDGYLYLVDRRDDMIVRAGVNVFPAEVEAALTLHPDVLSCAVIGLPDADLGQRIHAIIELCEGVKLEQFVDSMREFLKRHLSKEKHPATYEAVTGAIWNGAGKVRRSALREERIRWREAGIKFEFVQ